MLKRVSVCVVGLILFCVFIEGAYVYWVTRADQMLAPADMLVVFPGKPERVRAGYELARAGYGAALAIPGRSSDLLQAYGRIFEIDESFSFIPLGRSRTTFEDALLAGRVVRARSCRSVILVTSSYHMARAYLLLRMVLMGSGVDIQRYAVSDGMGVDAVSCSRRFFNEMVKMWAACGEAVWYGVSGRLMTDCAPLQSARLFLKERVLLKVE